MFLKFILVVLLFDTACNAIHPLIQPVALTEEDIQNIPMKAAGMVCEDVLFLACQNQFNQYLNISANTDWHNTTYMIEQLDQFYKQDLNSGLFVLCQARSRFERCLGGQYAACLNRLNFVRHNIANSEAYRFVAIFKMLEFECNGGNIQATKNWPCMYSIYASPTYQKAANDCMASYYSATQNQPDRICAAGQTLCKCLELQFTIGCARGILDMRWFECERIRTSFEIDGFCPNISCSTMVFGSAGFVIDPEMVEAHNRIKWDFYDSFANTNRRAKRQVNME
uniref:Uncharacterized protein n=1 Tax=Acrobeloides nanus TaxID=290746 RepID=A0A914CSS7_9BILA